MKTIRIAQALTIILLAVILVACGNSATPLPATLTPSNTPLPTTTSTPLPTNTSTPLPTNTPAPLPTNTPTPVPFDFVQAGQTIINNGFPLLTTSEQKPEVCPLTTCSVYRANNNYITVSGDGSIRFQQSDYGGGSFVFSVLFKDLFGQQVADAVNKNLPTSLGMSYTLNLNGFFISLEAPSSSSSLFAYVIPGGSEEAYHATQTAWAPKP